MKCKSWNKILKNESEAIPRKCTNLNLFVFADASLPLALLSHLHLILLVIIVLILSKLPWPQTVFVLYVLVSSIVDQDINLVSEVKQESVMQSCVTIFVLHVHIRLSTANVLSDPIESILDRKHEKCYSIVWNCLI